MKKSDLLAGLICHNYTSVMPPKQVESRRQVTKLRVLSKSFKPSDYDIELSLTNGTITGKEVIVGRKIGRPAKRITLHQDGLKITRASILKLDKNGDVPIKVIRINHHKLFQETRLHTSEMLFPSNYKISLSFSGPCKLTGAKLKAYLKPLEAGKHIQARQLFPLIDELTVEAIYKISYSQQK